jgi:2-oxoglutarate dehydrogenase complex dehydrogenase (E1) component-like enzyme
LYPYPEQRIAEVLAAYPNATEVVWCQEEPKNQGAWLFIAPFYMKQYQMLANKHVLASQVVKLLLHQLVVHHICMQNNKLN